MEYSIGAFANEIRNTLYQEFPYEGEYLKQRKHKKTPQHIRDVAFFKNEMSISENIITFDIGNEYSEENYPYYHILQDAYAIKKKGKGTKKSKGSQAEIQDLKSRNYGFVQWNGKTFTKEYQKNVRGSRNRLASISHWATMNNGNRIFINRESNSYLNVHYHYIEKTLNAYLDFIAQEFGLKRGRTMKSSLAEELAFDWDESIETVLDTFGSFE